MKLYSQFSVLIALCTFMVTIHAMEPTYARHFEKMPGQADDEIIFKEIRREISVSDMTPGQKLNYPTFQQELKLRLDKYPNNFEELNKSRQHMVYQVVRGNLIPTILSSERSFGEQLIDFNYIDLLSQFLDHVQIRGHEDEYRKWLGSGIKNGNTKAVNVILDYASDGFIGASYVSLAVDSFVNEKVNSLPIIKLLLTRDVTWERGVGAGLLARVINSRQHFMSDDDKKPYLLTLMISGANHDVQVRWISLQREDMSSVTPMNYANDDLKLFMSKVAAARDGLFKIVQKNEMGIGFICMGDYSRRQLKDIQGYNLLHYALLGKNKAVADKLFGLWPKMLWERNFEGKAIIDHEQAMHNFIEMYLQGDELKPLAIMFSYLLKKIS